MQFSGGRRVLLCFFLAIVKDACGQTKPSNGVAEIGGEAVFNCSGISFLPNWLMSRDGTTTNQLPIAGSCVVNGNVQNHYRTEPIGPLECNLIVFNVTMEQAGVYWCSDGVPSYALLTVTDSSPVIAANNTTSVVENDTVIIACSLKHNGSVASAPTLRPYFYWTNSNLQNVSSSNDSTTDNTTVSQLTVTAGRQNITPCTCHVYLKLTPPTTSGYASNTPTVSNSASSTTIEVLYGPSVPVLTSRPEVITLNGVSCGISVLMCTSTGNPPPKYNWFDTAENVNISNEQTLTLAEVNRNYKCEAYNTIRNVLFTKSATYTVSRNDSVSYLQYCVYPRDETTLITVDGCDNGTMCDCSGGSSGVTLTCNAITYPNASYIWHGSDGNVIYSQVHNEITMNGTYWCTVYFNRTSSNYTGSVAFRNGTNETTVSSCCGSWQLIISAIIPYIGGNAIVLVAFFVVYFRSESFAPIMDQRFPVHTTGKVVLLVITSIFVGLISVPILVTIAFVSSLKQVGNATTNGEEIHQMKEGSSPPSITGTDPTGNSFLNAVGSSAGLSIWKIALMWSVAVALLFPTTFLVVYFVPCNQMRYEIA